jgi:CHAD domain-containing protein
MVSESLPQHSPEDDARVGPGDPASLAIAEAFSTAVARLREANEQARAGDVKGIRRLRTSSRRLRSQLQAFGKLIEPKWGGRLIAELRWLGAALGEARDLDVLRKRFEKDESEEDRAALEPLFAWLAGRRARAGEAVDRTINGARFRALMAKLERSAEAPSTTKRACKPCRKVLPPLVAGSWKRLRRDAKGLTSGTPDTVFHEVRNRAKRARYTTELIAPKLGRKAESRGVGLIAFARSIQDTLGAHQDAVVAAAEVESMLAQGGHDDAFRRAAAALLSRLRRDADEARDVFLSEHLPGLRKRKHRGDL